MKVVWRRSALADRDAIITYIEERNPLAAFELLGALVRAVDRLVEFPYIGRVGLATHTRELVVISPYILIYEIQEDEIQIVRVWHGARNR
jgi:addiction module RelE/StbE family toxin